MAKKVEGPQSSFCVGLNAPWGAGKTFLYKLVKAELSSTTIEERAPLQEEDSNDSRNNDRFEGIKEFFNGLSEDMEDNGVIKYWTQNLETLQSRLEKRHGTLASVNKKGRHLKKVRARISLKCHISEEK